MRLRASLVLFLAIVLVGSALATAQTAKQNYPMHFPYRFSNFPWWTDTELRAALKERIPELSDEVNVEAMGRVRAMLKVLMKEKGIAAEIQSIEPSYSSLNPQEAEEIDFWGMHFPPPPKPGIEFSILTPSVLIGRVSFLPEGGLPVLAAQSEAKEREGKPFTVSDELFMQYRAQKVLRQNGYLAAEVRISHGSPRREGADILVDLTLDVNSGPRFTVSSISADGGPTLQGKDLSSMFAVKAGDTAGRDPFQRIDPGLREWYRSFGYLEVQLEHQSLLDRERALVSYRLSVIPGPVYHLRQLTVRNLNSAQEAKVRELLGMRPGDPFNTNAVDTLQQKCDKEPIFNGRNVVFEVKNDVEAKAVDLTIESFD
jgi:outer membrane protein insertion porin family